MTPLQWPRHACVQWPFSKADIYMFEAGQGITLFKKSLLHQNENDGSQY